MGEGSSRIDKFDPGHNGQRPALDVWVIRRLLGGWTPKAIVAASNRPVSVRTVYRWRRRIRDLEEVEVGGYVATFAHCKDAPPIRLSGWRTA